MPAPRVFFDIAIEGEPVGRVIIELFNKKTPITCENFRLLCTSSTTHDGSPLTFTACPIHRVIPSFIIQTGDITSGDGTGGHSALGEKFFADENLGWRDIDEAGLVCMANKGADTNSSQWFITMDEEAGKELKMKNTVFGRVVEGMDVLRRVEEEECGDGDRPIKKVEIERAGELVFKPKVAEGEGEKVEAKEERRSRRHEGGHRRRHRRRSQSPDHPQRGRSRTGTESPEVERRYWSRSRSRGHRSHRHRHRHRRHLSRSASASRSRSKSRRRHDVDARRHDVEMMMRDPEEERRIEREERERERGRLEGLPIVEDGGVKFKGRGSMKYRERKRWGGGGQWGGGYGRLN